MSSTKSGEILRIGHGNYCFLCIHCGFTFPDLQDILGHIDSHFETGSTGSPDTKIDVKDSTIVRDFYEFSMQQSDEAVIESEIQIKSEIVTEDLDQTKNDIELAKTLDWTDSQKTKEIINERKRKRSRNSRIKNPISKIQCEVCPICELTFENSVSCQDHLRTNHHMGKKVFQCFMCSLYFTSLSLLKVHRSCSLYSKPNLNCYQCELEPRIANEMDSRPHKCFFCKQWLPNHSLFRKHFKNEHNEDVEKFFRKRSNFNEYTCYICQKDFKVRNYLTRHMAVHQEKAYICDFCGKTYRTKGILNRHLKIHEGKTYTCSDCGKTFGYYARLRIHRYSHRTESNYKCVICFKAFKVQKYLARHMVIHRDEKKFGCRYCEKKFTFSTGRRAHEISQHNAV